MPLYRATVILKATSNLIEDASTNTWHFDANAIGDLAAASAALQTFYQSMRVYLTTLTTQNNHEIKWYRLSDPTPRAPVRIDNWNFSTAPSLQPLPTEVAIVGSFQGTPSSGQSQARRRGRIYFGPVGTTTATSAGYISDSVRIAFRDALNTMLTASNAQGQWKWAVYSTVNMTGVNVAAGWVENAFDTQRRRGRIATIRSVFP